MPSSLSPFSPSLSLPFVRSPLSCISSGPFVSHIFPWSRHASYLRIFLFQSVSLHIPPLYWAFPHFFLRIYQLGCSLVLVLYSVLLSFHFNHSSPFFLRVSSPFVASKFLPSIPSLCPVDFAAFDQHLCRLAVPLRVLCSRKILHSQGDSEGNHSG